MAEVKNIGLKYFLIVIIVILLLQLAMVSLGKKKAEILTDNKTTFLNLDNKTYVELKLPAVDADGNGVSTKLSVEATPGEGRTLVDIENLLFWQDTQQSIRMARFVASNFSKNNVNRYNLIYNIQANASLIGGPSAGAAITIATIFALNHEQPRNDVMITGTINHDGTIGPVGGILEKARASKQAGATIFLVPLLQSRDVVYETTKHCQQFGASEVCESETIAKKIDVNKETNITIIEVGSIDEALKYFKQ